MAKVGFWLKGTTGKMAGATMYKDANGDTVIREVVKPSNPQTVPQLVQRVIMKTVAVAYSQTKALSDHAFEGVSGSAQNMQKFMQMNLNIMRDKVTAAVEAGTSLYNVLSFSPLGRRMLATNNYFIAQGSLPEIKTVAPAAGATPNGIIALSANTYQALVDDYGLRRGDQVTFVALVKAASSDAAHLAYARVIIDPMEADGDKLPLSTTLVADGAISKPSLRNAGSFSALSYGDSQLVFNPGQGTVVASAVIVSRKGSDDEWRRSNAQLLVLSQEGDLSLQECLEMTNASSLEAASDLYLNNAGTRPLPNDEESDGESGGSGGGDNGGGDDEGPATGQEQG